MEMRIEPFIKSTFEKYLSGEDDEYLFVFHSRYSNSDSFNANVNIGIRKICADMGMKKKITTAITRSGTRGRPSPKTTVTPTSMKWRSV